MAFASTRIVRWALCGLAIFSCGCSLTPYITLPKHDLKGDGEVPLTGGLEYASSVRSLYYDALNRETITRNLAANGLILAGGAVIGLTAFGATKGAILGTSLGAGTGYALGTFNTSRPREAVYIGAIQGINCAVAAVGPLAFDKEQRAAIQEDLDKLNGGISNTGASIATVRELAGKLPAKESATKKEATDAADAAAGLVGKASDVYSAGRQLLADVGRAGYALVSAVDQISDLANHALYSTQTDLSSVPNVVKNLSAMSDVFSPTVSLTAALAAGAKSGQSASGALQASRLQELRQSLTGGPEVAPTPGPTAEQRIEELRILTKLEKERQTLGDLAGTLQAASRRVSALLESTSSRRALDSLKACGVETEVRLTAAPSEVTFREGEVATSNVIVRGGKKPYVALFLLQPAAGLTIRPPIPGDSVFQISSDATTSPGTYPLAVMDAAEHTVVVPVTVTGTTTP